MNTTRMLSRDDLLTDCERSMRYHQARARFYNNIHLLIQFLVFILASASVSRLLDTLLTGQVLLWFSAAIGFLALFSLVYNPAEKSGLHKSLYRGFTMLNGTVVATPDASQATLAEWTRTIYGLYAEEPPVYRALLAHCDNQVAIALNKVNEGYFVDLRWHHRLLRNLIPFQGTEFPNRNQVHS